MSQQVNKEDLAAHNEVAREVAMTDHFWAGFNKSKEAGNKFEQALDSLMGSVAGQANLPISLQKIFAHPAIQSKEAREIVLDGLEFGIKAYQASNGGDMPDPTLMAAALCEGASMLADSQFQSALDSLTNAHHEQLSVVPEMVQVTISTRLSTGLPFFSQLPNPKGSNELPFLIANIVAGSDFAGMRKGDRLDGAKAGSSFVFNKRIFAMSKDGLTNEYTVTPRVRYANEADKTPDSGSDAAPFLGGRVLIRVNGVAVASDQASGSANSGTTQITAVRGATVGGETLAISAGVVDLDDHEISVTFGADLPAGAVVHAEVIFDFERKDSSKKPILNRPDSEIAYKKHSIFAVPSSAETYISVDAQTQMQNELGISPQAAAMGQLQAKQYLEENYYLFWLLALQARKAGRVIQFDYARGADPGLAAAYNNTADGIAYINTTLRTAALNIRNITLDNGSTDIIAGDHACILLSVLDESDSFKLVEGAVMNNGNVTRMGKFSDGRGLYHLPTQAGILPEGATTATIMVIARGSRPELNPTVGMTAVPPTFIDLTNKAFEKGVGFYSRRAVDVNPHQQYADGVYLIDMINLPQLS